MHTYNFPMSSSRGLRSRLNSNAILQAFFYIAIQSNLYDPVAALEEINIFERKRVQIYLFLPYHLWELITRLCKSNEGYKMTLKSQNLER